MRGMNGIQLAIFTSAWILLLTVIGRVLKAKTEDGENFLAVAFAFILFAAVLFCCSLSRECLRIYEKKTT